MEKDFLISVFKEFTDEQKDNLRWHLKNGTPISTDRDSYINGSGHG